MKKFLVILSLCGLFFSCRDMIGSGQYQNSGRCDKLTDAAEMEKKVYDTSHDTVVLYTREDNQACNTVKEGIVEKVVKVNPTVEFYEIDVDSDFYKNQQATSSVIAKSGDVAESDLPVIVFYKLGVKANEHRGEVTAEELNEFVSENKTSGGGGGDDEPVNAAPIPDWMKGTWYENGAKRVEIADNSIDYVGLKNEKFKLLKLDGVSTKLVGSVYEVSNRWNTYKFTNEGIGSMKLDIHQFNGKGMNNMKEMYPETEDDYKWHDTHMTLLNTPPSVASIPDDGPGIPSGFGDPMPSWMYGVWYKGAEPKMFVSQKTLYYDGEEYLGKGDVKGTKTSDTEWKLSNSSGYDFFKITKFSDEEIWVRSGGAVVTLYKSPGGASADTFLHPTTVAKHVKFMGPTYVKNPKGDMAYDNEMYRVPKDYKYEPMVTRYEETGEIYSYWDSFNDKRYVCDWSNVELNHGYFDNIWSWPGSLYLYYVPFSLASSTCWGSLREPCAGIFADYDWTRLYGIDSNPAPGYDIRFAYWTDDPSTLRKFPRLTDASNVGGATTGDGTLNLFTFFDKDVTLYAVYESVPQDQGYEEMP